MQVLLRRGITPNAEGMAYTAPAITFSDGTHMQDSRKIADKLEKDYPSPSMNLDAPVLKDIEAIMPMLMGALTPVIIPLVPRHILPER
jgi:hypothetical protein